MRVDSQLSVVLFVTVLYGALTARVFGKERIKEKNKTNVCDILELFYINEEWCKASNSSSVAVKNMDLPHLRKERSVSNVKSNEKNTKSSQSSLSSDESSDDESETADTEELFKFHVTAHQPQIKSAI